MVINHHKLRAETLRKFALFYKDNIKFGGVWQSLFIDIIKTTARGLK